ncbi:MAG: hypothetical protein H0X39_00225 [Actinobacteria bacterium]|nr:hypothetical protein [Actinomycetota bacterium]
MADYWSQAQLDPAYLATHGGLSKSLKDLILNYGSSSALSPEEAARYGIAPGDVAAADQNPYSVQAQLRQQLSGNQYGITNNANAHGALFSGGHAAMQAHELQNSGQRNYNASQALGAAIGGIDQQNTNAITGAYGTLAQNALNDPAIPVAAPVAAALAPAAAPVAAPGPTSTFSYGPQGATPVVYGPQNQPGAPTIKKPKLPKLSTGLQGHL